MDLNPHGDTNPSNQTCVLVENFSLSCRPYSAPPLIPPPTIPPASRANSPTVASSSFELVVTNFNLIRSGSSRRRPRWAPPPDSHTPINAAISRPPITDAPSDRPDVDSFGSHNSFVAPSCWQRFVSTLQGFLPQQIVPVSPTLAHLIWAADSSDRSSFTRILSKTGLRVIAPPEVGLPTWRAAIAAFIHARAESTSDSLPLAVRYWREAAHLSRIIHCSLSISVLDYSLAITLAALVGEWPGARPPPFRLAIRATNLLPSSAGSTVAPLVGLIRSLAPSISLPTSQSDEVCVATTRI